MKIQELKAQHPRVFQRLYKQWCQHAPGYEWWDSTIEDAVVQGGDRGFEIGTHNNRPMFYFSGFWSQGDGASWSGTIDVPKWVEWAKANGGAPFTDTQLLWMAEAWRNGYMETTLRILANNNGHYSHSGTMCLGNELECTDDRSYDTEVREGVFKGMDSETFVLTFRKMMGIEIEEEALKAARAFADEYYKILNDDFDYLMSEEHFIEQQEDAEYDEEGEEI